MPLAGHFGGSSVLLVLFISFRPDRAGVVTIHRSGPKKQQGNSSTIERMDVQDGEIEPNNSASKRGLGDAPQRKTRLAEEVALDQKRVLNRLSRKAEDAVHDQRHCGKVYTESTTV